MTTQVARTGSIPPSRAQAIPVIHPSVMPYVKYCATFGSVMFVSGGSLFTTATIWTSTVESFAAADWLGAVLLAIMFVAGISLVCMAIALILAGLNGWARMVFLVGMLSHALSGLMIPFWSYVSPVDALIYPVYYFSPVVALAQAGLWLQLAAGVMGLLVRGREKD